MIKKLLEIFYVYVYLDPRKPGKHKYGPYEFDYEPFYVGKGHGDRICDHIKKWSLKSDTNTFKCNKIRKIKKETGADPIIIKYKENLHELDAFSFEIDMISKIGRYNKKLGPLTNLTDGGDGMSGYIVSEERKAVFSAFMKGRYPGEKNPNYNNRWSEEQKENGRKNKIKYEYRLLSPENKNVFTKSLRNFCKDINLDFGAMLKVVKGKIYHHKGWKGFIIGQEHLREYIEKNYCDIIKNRYKKSENSKLKNRLSHLKYEYRLISPTGLIFKTNNLKEFCKTNGIFDSAMSRVVLGKQYSHEGWVGYIVGKEYLRIKIQENCKMVNACSPDGIFYENIPNLKNFCKEFNITYQNVLYSLKSGTFIKGWYFFRESINAD